MDGSTGAGSVQARRPMYVDNWCVWVRLGSLEHVSKLLQLTSTLKLRHLGSIAVAGILMISGGASAQPAEAEAGAEPAPVDNSARATEVYGERLDNLQTEVNALKEQIFRSKARLSVLREAVRGAMEGSRVVLAHRNVMGTGFRLIKVVYKLDGAPVFVREDDSGALDEIDEFVVYDGNLGSGLHAATVELTYRGHGYGVFNYLREYNFNSRSSHGFTVPARGSVKLVSVGFESGNLTTEMQDRPAVDWQEQVLDAAGNPVKPGQSNKRARGKATGASKKDNSGKKAADSKKQADGPKPKVDAKADVKAGATAGDKKDAGASKPPPAKGK